WLSLQYVFVGPLHLVHIQVLTILLCTVISKLKDIGWKLLLILPLNEWYIHTNRNDLMYWGLDYPPLTAYHSFLFGKLAQYFNVSW
ncbi:3-glucosyltransferase,Dolichyl pyrophosphate Man9GlcNAc2 alpha-1, partial [Trichinella pseudospiralis]